MTLKIAIVGAQREIRKMNRELKKIDRDVNTAAHRAINKAIQGVHTGSVRAVAAYTGEKPGKIKKFLRRYQKKRFEPGDPNVWLGSTAITKTKARTVKDGRPLVVGRKNQKAPAHQTPFNIRGKKPQFLRETRKRLPIGIAGIQQFETSKRLINPILRINGFRLFRKEFRRQLRLLRGGI